MIPAAIHDRLVASMYDVNILAELAEDIVHDKLSSRQSVEGQDVVIVSPQTADRLHLLAREIARITRDALADVDRVTVVEASR